MHSHLSSPLVPARRKRPGTRPSRGHDDWLQLPQGWRFCVPPAWPELSFTRGPLATSHGRAEGNNGSETCLDFNNSCANRNRTHSALLAPSGPAISVGSRERDI
ncbi:hypothetical protein HMPREF9946_04666 [Acetobacteraceae bacterium AT-5844]|nr:hypothetical protein HMPREF9946_04666 [Acetobacteraceae bacterium AT-5844]